MTRYWNQKLCKEEHDTDSTKKIDAFMVDIFAVYEKHGLSISHEDSHGGFIVESNSAANQVWLKAASFSLD